MALCLPQRCVVRPQARNSVCGCVPRLGRVQRPFLQQQAGVAHAFAMPTLGNEKRVSLDPLAESWSNQSWQPGRLITVGTATISQSWRQYRLRILPTTCIPCAAGLQPSGFRPHSRGARGQAGGSHVQIALMPALQDVHPQIFSHCEYPGACMSSRGSCRSGGLFVRPPNAL